MTRRSLAKALRDARVARGFSHDTLAREAGIPVRTLFRLEGRQTKSPHEDTIRKLVAVLPDLIDFLPMPRTGTEG